MEFGFIGAGAIASAVAGHLVRAGHPVTLSNRRGPDSLKEKVAALGPLARAGTRAEAAAAPLVFLSETGSEVVASKAPEARVIKAFNTLFAPDVARDPRHDGGQRVLFYCGDDPDAKAAFAGVVGEAGWFPADLGGLRDGGRLMQVGGPLPGLHLLTQHAEPAPREDSHA